MLAHAPRILLALIVAGCVAGSVAEIFGALTTRAEYDLWRFRRDDAFGEGAVDRGRRRALAHLALVPPSDKSRHNASVRALIDSMEAARELVPADALLVYRFELDRFPPSKSQVLLAARSLLYPRRIEPELTLRRAIQAGEQMLDAQTWVIDLRPEMPIEAAEYWHEAAAGKGWLLRRWSKQP
jgi:hypothetical protein